MATKVDKLKPNEVQNQLHKIQEAYGLPSSLFIPFSSITGEGKGEVWKAIRDSMEQKGIAYDDMEDEEVTENFGADVTT